ncbi:MAG: recombinase [Candidatus Dojkabacteria bacterium]
MRHIPIGYQIENGKALIDEEAAEKIKVLFQSYLSGDSLETAAKKAGIKSSHSGIGRLLRNKRYLGNEYYPAIIDSDTFQAAEAERFLRAEQLGRIKKPEREKEVIYPTDFRIQKGTVEFDDPFAQAEYIYSLIEVMEVNENGGK